MPIFEYQCKACGKVFDHLARTAKDKPNQCPACGAKQLTKQFSTFSASMGTPKGTSCSMGNCSKPTCASGCCPFG